MAGGPVNENAGEMAAGDNASETLEISYPEEDRMLSNSSWVKLVEECIELFSEIERWRQAPSELEQNLVEHILYRLTEILQRSGVTLIDNDAEFDPRRHECDPFWAEVPPGACIVKTIRHGFAVGRRVFLKAVVQIDRKDPSSTS